MLKRKIINKLVEWKNGCSNKALLIKGARQVGKTTIIRQFAQANYENFIEPKSVIRISLCRTAKRNLLIFPI